MRYTLHGSTAEKEKIERILSLVAKNYYIILQIKNISQKTIIDFCLKLILSPVLASVWSFRLKKGIIHQK